MSKVNHAGIPLSRINTIAKRIKRLPQGPERQFCWLVLPLTSIVADKAGITTQVPEYNEWVSQTFDIVEKILARLERHLQ